MHIYIYVCVYLSIYLSDLSVCMCAGLILVFVLNGYVCVPLVITGVRLDCTFDSVVIF